MRHSMIMSAVLLLALSAPASAQEAVKCVKKSLMTFRAGGKPLPAGRIEVIGLENPCVVFGGERVRTPKHGIMVYVNFNIAGTIDLNFIDKAFEELSDPAMRPRLQKIDLVLVTREWMKRVKGDDYPVGSSGSFDTLYISERVLSENIFEKIVTDFYGEFSAANIPGIQM